jgi:hypothetical protein
MMEALGDYRLPPSIHDLFVNDLHRQFYQIIHRSKQDDVESGQNADNVEIYAGSPSYLITAGGSPAGEAINTGLASITSPSKRREQLGVAVTTSFMPTGQSAGPYTQNYARDVIQFSSFAEEGPVENYGVAPDFACGHWVRLPEWCVAAINPNENLGNFCFVNKDNGREKPGFFLAIYRDPKNLFAVMEAYDTWLKPGLDWNKFRNGVWHRNMALSLKNHVETQFVTTNGSPADAIVVITNPLLQQQITLDWNDPNILKRTSENGEVEVALESGDSEVWVDFAWDGPEEGDFFHPFRTAATAVTAGGLIKILPGSTHERPFLSGQKAVRIEAAIGGVVIGMRP